MAAPTPVSKSWPETLPAPSVSYSIRLDNTTIRTDMDYGRSRSRRRTTAEIHQVGISWQMTDLQFQYFKGWYRLTLQGGSLPFNIDLAFGDDLKANVAEFDGTYSSQYIESFDWVVSAVLIVQDANVIETEFELLIAGFALAGIDGDDQLALLNSLEDMVNNNNFS